MRNKPRLLTPGPTPLPERVRLALATDMIHHRTRFFGEIMDDVRRDLRTLFGTSGEVLPLACSGTGAMTAAVHGLFSPGEQVLVVEGGVFGKRWTDIATTHGLKVIPLPVRWGTAVTPEQVAEAMATHPRLAGVLVQASETSTGVRHPVRELAVLTAATDTLLVVDGISAVGISPCPMDDWGIDCLLTGSQKGLMLPPGLALLALSERGWKRAETVAPSCFYFNLPGERVAVQKGQGRFTSPVNLIVGLRESLRMLLEPGDLREVFRKQWALTRMARAGIEAMGLSCLVEEHHATWGLTAVRLVEGMNAAETLRRLDEDYSLILAEASGDLKNNVIRLGHMGWVDWGDVLAALCALESLVPLATSAGNLSCAQIALAAYQQALTKKCPKDALI